MSLLVTHQGHHLLHVECPRSVGKGAILGAVERLDGYDGRHVGRVERRRVHQRLRVRRRPRHGHRRREIFSGVRLITAIVVIIVGLRSRSTVHSCFVRLVLLRNHGRNYPIHIIYPKDSSLTTPSSSIAADMEREAKIRKEMIQVIKLIDHVVHDLKMWMQSYEDTDGMVYVIETHRFQS